jgi:hypothetical protein
MAVSQYEQKAMCEFVRICEALKARVVSVRCAVGIPQSKYRGERDHKLSRPGIIL